MMHETEEQAAFEQYYSEYWNQLSEYDLDQMYQEFLSLEGSHSPAPPVSRAHTDNGGSNRWVFTDAQLEYGERYRLAA